VTALYATESQVRAAGFHYAFALLRAVDGTPSRR
jgi:hypothetical protein